MAVAVAIGVGQRDPRLVLVAPLVTFIYGVGSLNSYGADRAAVWLLVVSGPGSQADLAGKNLAGVLVMLPVVTTMSAALAAITGGWSYVPVALLSGLALLGVSFGVGNLASVLAPMPMPESGTNLWATSGGAGCATLLVQLVAFTIQGLLLLPAIGGFVAALLLRPTLLPLAAAGALVWGAGVWWVGLRAAATTGDARGPELVAALSRTTA
jgi:ABC-2 type transport system permease protein